MQFHFSCKFSVEFSASSFCLSFGNVKIILNNPVYFNVNILTLFVSIFIVYLYFVWLRFHYNLLIRRSEFLIGSFRDQVKRFRSTVA